MKSKLYRVLVLLVAIAMMIPSFAMAEEVAKVTEGKLEITSTEKEIKDTFLSGDANTDANTVISDEKNKIKFAYAVPTDALGDPSLTWTTSNPAVAVVADTSVAKGDSKTDQTVTVTKKGVGTAKITGQLSYDGTVQKTAEFTVTLEAVDVESIAFNEGIQQRYFVSSTPVSFADKVKVTSKQGGSTYTEADLAWKIVSGDLAKVNNSGKVLFEKAGEVTLRAYIPGSEKKAEVKLTVLDPEPGASVEQDKNGYTFLDFNTPEETGEIFRADSNGKLELDNYLTKRIATNVSDTLDWTVDDESIAEVDYAGCVTINKAGRGKKVKVTVTSRNTGESDWCYVIWENAEDTSKAYTKLAFNPTEKTFRVKGVGATQKVDITNLLSVKEPTDAKDTLVWKSSDYSVADFEYEGNDVYLVPLKLDKEVTITVHSKLDSKVVTNPGLKVKFVEEATEIPYTKIEFDGEKKLPVTKGVNQTVKFDLKKDYMTLEPSTANETLYFYSNNEDVAKVDSDDGDLEVCAKKDGTATITVANAKGDKTDTLTVEVTVVTDPYTKLAFKEFLQHKKTVKMTKGANKLTLATDEYLTTEGGSDDELKWTSSDKTIAKVNNKGVVTLVGEGTARITVRNYDNTKTDYIDLTVEEVKKPFTELAFKPAEPLTRKLSEKKVNLKNKLLYTVPEAAESDDELTWTVDDTTVATVKNGVVEFKSAGTVKVKVSNVGGTKSAEITITIVDDKDVFKTITLAAESIKVAVDDWIDLEEYVTTDPAKSDVDDLVWTSSNQQIVKFPVEKYDEKTQKFVPVSGVAHAIAKGEVTVTVYSKLNPENKKTFKLVVTDKEGKVESLKILEGNDQFTLKTGEGDIYLSRYVLVTPVDALDKATYDEAADELVFTSDDTDILTVDKDTGLVHLNGKPGTAKITVRSKKNPEAQAQFTITHAKAELKSMKFVDAPKTLSRTGSVDLKNYLVTDPWYYTDKTYATTDLYWESSDPQIATALNGVLTWKGVGKVTITVTEINSKKTATHEIELTDPSAVQEIILKDITLTAGDNVKLTDFMTINPLDAVYENVKFTSSDRNVAEILKKKTDPDDEDGREGYQQYYLGAYRGGESTITVYVENYDKSVKTATCKVTVIGNNDVEDVKIAKNKYALKLNTKTSVVVRFNAEPYNCDIDEDDIYVVSSNSAIADTDDITVDSKGRKGHFTVYAKKPGTVWFTIKRTKDDKELDACKIIISAVRVKSVKWEKDAVKLYWYNDGITDYYDGTQSNTVYKNYVDIKPIINPANAYCNVTFETTDPGVAFVDSKSIKGFQNALASGSSLSDVKITAVGPGKCKIIMKVDDGKKVRKATLNVEVETKQPKLKISQRKATLKLEKGSDILYLRAFDAYTDKDIEVKWTSSDTSVAKVNVDGKVRAVGAGKATITATTKNGQKQVVKCKITVKAPSTENVAAKKITGDTKVTVKAGEKKALEIKVKPEGAKVTFTSSDSKIVKVTKDGTIKGIKAGKATITVKAAEGKAELKIKVVVK